MMVSGADMPADPYGEARQDLRMGIAGYRRFRDRLSAAIGPADAVSAREAFARSGPVLPIFLLGWLALAALNAFFGGVLSATAFRMTSDALVAILLLGALVLGAGLGVPAAGRVLFTAYGVVLALWVGTMREFYRGLEWDDFSLTLDVAPLNLHRSPHFEGPAYVVLIGIVLVLGLSFFALGALFDYGASRQPWRRRPRWRRVCLAGWALVWIFAPLVVLAAPWSPDVSRGLSYSVTIDAHQRAWMTRSAAVFCLLFACVPERLRPRSWRTGPSDAVSLIVHAAHARFLRHWGGWMLAIAVGLFPFWMFLNCLGLKDRLDSAAHALERGMDDPVIRTGRETRDVWFWATQGRLLRQSDLTSSAQTLYGGDFSGAAAGPSGAWGAPDPIWAGMTIGQQIDPAYVAAYEQILVLIERPRSSGLFLPADVQHRMGEILERYRIHSEAQFDGLVSGRTNTGDILTVLAFEPPSPGRRASPDRELAYAERLYAWPLPETWPAAFATFYWWFLWPALLTISALGFVFLWRRGGDSPVARWIGIGLVAHAGSTFFWFAEYFRPAIVHQLEIEALGSSLSGLLTVIVMTNVLISKALHAAITYVDVPVCVLAVHLGWPRPTRAEMPAWVRHVHVAVGVVLTGAAAFLLGRCLDYLYSWIARGDADILTMVVSPTAIVLLAATALRGRRQSAGVWLPVIGVVALIECPMLMELALDPHAVRPALFWSGWTLALLGLGIFTVLLRQNYLRVMSVTTLSYVAMVVVVPTAIVVFEEVVKDVFRRIPSLSEKGGEVIAIAGVVALLPLIHRTIEFIAGQVFVRRLHMIEHEVGRVLEAMVDEEKDEERRATVAKLFQRIGVGGYALYTRKGGGVFRLHLHRTDGSPRETIQLSAFLREFLASRRTFIDLNAAPFEWAYFFHQFELGRVESATGCRHLLPVCIGKSVRGLLLLPDGVAEEGVSRHPAAQEFGSLGLAAISI
jgi:hypothetical protein